LEIGDSLTRLLCSPAFLPINSKTEPARHAATTTQLTTSTTR
jgi:hypothetical protein